MGKQAASRDKAPQNLLIALQEAQERLGFLPPELMAELAESFNVPVNDVYGVATFYSFLYRRPMGRNVIRICRSLPCYLEGGQLVAETIARKIGIKPGQTTPDGRFSLELANCIGLCDRAPAMLINDDAHVSLTPRKIAAILQEYK